ncbi:polysaccharide pyruvyl transferase family protein [Planococcus rifietoensis]|uniref:polysaccharide pyruvyl transferase family protein n=1 Tax=Planococcus rifietoensis TaxID=200991 RepID=UPI0032183391
MQKTSFKNIALHGSYYHHNFGDLLMLDIMTKWIKEENDLNKVFLPHASESVANVLAVDGFGIKSLLKADALIYGGGGYLGEPPTKKYLWGLRASLRHTPASHIMKVRNKPYSIIGVGVGPLTNPVTRQSFSKMCKTANTLAVRDEESRNYLIEYGVPKKDVIQTSDMVMQLNKKDIDPKYFLSVEKSFAAIKSTFKIGIHLADNPYPEETEMIKNEIVELGKKYPNICFILLRDGVGSHPAVLHEIHRELPNSSLIFPYENHWQFSAAIGLLDMIVTTKLHVGITASALGKIAISFSAHGKTPRFYKQIKASERCIPLTEIKKGQAYEVIDSYIKKLPLDFTMPEELVSSSLENKRLVQSFLKSL